jgi:hypothetical protein
MRFTITTTPEEDEMLAYLAEATDMAEEQIIENVLRMMLEAWIDDRPGS